jgi:hypothetical protein
VNFKECIGKMKLEKKKESMNKLEVFNHGTGRVSHRYF